MASTVSFLLVTCPSAMMMRMWYWPCKEQMSVALLIRGANEVGPVRVYVCVSVCACSASLSLYPPPPRWDEEGFAVLIVMCRPLSLTRLVASV